MRVLSVGNMYPPHHLGGYELMWRSAVRHLRSAGHEVRVLTTDHRSPDLDPGLEEDSDVHRELRWYWRDHDFPRMGLRERLSLERQNAATLERHMSDLEPDAVNWWAMGGMSLALIEQVRRAHIPGVGFVHDDWMIYGPKVDAWQRATRRLGPLRRLAERVARVPARVDLGAAGSWVFVSDYVRRRALEVAWPLPHTGVAHSGIEQGLFKPAPERPWRGRLLYLGRIDRRKGITTAVRALGVLPDCRLTVVGGGDENHLDELRALASQLGVEARVSFDRRPRDEVPAAYAEADALLFPAVWPEPFGLVPLEAMAVGTPVVATGTGGSGEYLRHEHNCLIFEPREDPDALAAAVARLAHEPALRSSLRASGLRTAAEHDEENFNRAVRRAIEAVAS